MATPTRLVWLLVGLMGLWGMGGCAHPPSREGPESTRAALSLYLRGLMLERSTNLLDALDAYRQALEHDYRSPALHVRIGATHVKLGQPDAALKSFERALAIDPSQPDALRWVAMLHTSQGRIDNAIEAYERLLEQDPTNRFVLSTLADLYVLQGELAKAAELYDRLIREHGASSQLHFNLGVLYGRLGQFALAIEELSRALELAPDSVEVRVALALMYEMNQQPEHAAAHYEEAIRVDPLNPRLYHHAARVAANLNRRKEAVQLYQTLLDLAPNDLEAIIGLVRLWMLDKQYAHAQQLVAQKLQTLRYPPELYLILGFLYREANVPHEALRSFERAVVLQDTSAQAHFHLGAQLERLHREHEARQELRRAIKLDPNYADALNYLGYMDAEDGTNLDEARALIERALALDPDNGAYVDSLGWAYYQLGDLEEAIRLLERAAQLLDTDPIIFDHLGDVHFKRGDIENAKAAWEKALELDSSLEAVQRKLDALLQEDVAAPTP